MGHPEQIVWMLVVFVLLYVELRSIDKDRDDNQKQQAIVRGIEADRFQAILKENRDGIATILDEQRKKSDTTMQEFSKLLQSGKETASMASHAVEVLTGGSSYPRMTISWSTASPKIYLMPQMIRMSNRDDAAEYGYEISEKDERDTQVPCPFWHYPLIPVQNGSTGPIQFPFTQTLIGPITPKAQGVTHYVVHLAAKNGMFRECLAARGRSPKLAKPRS